MFMRVAVQRTHNVQTPHYFGGSQVPIHLDLKPSMYSGRGVKSEKVAKEKKKLYQKGKEMVKK